MEINNETKEGFFVDKVFNKQKINMVKIKH